MSAAAAPGTRFGAAFAARRGEASPGLIPYLTAGFPALESLPELLLAAQEAGAMAAEVGIPFSDPLADGPTIQRAGQRALEMGMTLGLALEQVAAARSRGVTVPLAVMTYVNPVLASGIEDFTESSLAAGVDGVIVPDLPHEEAAVLRPRLEGAGIALIPLVAPTTPHDRLHAITAAASAFVYCVGVTGVTGSRTDIAPEAIALLDDVGTCTSLPRALGFGLSRHEHMVALHGHAEAAVVGSALLDAVGAEPERAAAVVERFCRAMLA